MSAVPEKLIAKNLTYTILIHPAEEGGYWVSVPALPGCFTIGETIDEARENATEAILCHVKGLIKDGDEVPTEETPPQISRVEVTISNFPADA
ncbi:type II toxin-antitoxin system HicB family antitoxin [bacterium]|nr:type II toxin-antitoxin system HicB family antitoxin [bacterium]